MILRNCQSPHRAILGPHFAFALPHRPTDPVHHLLAFFRRGLSLVRRRHGLVLQLLEDVFQQKQLPIFQAAIENIDPDPRLHLLLAVAAVAVALQERLNRLAKLKLELPGAQIRFACLLLGHPDLDHAPQSEENREESSLRGKAKISAQSMRRIFRQRRGG